MIRIFLIIIMACTSLYSQNKDTEQKILNFIKSHQCNIDSMDNYSKKLSRFQYKNIKIYSIDTLFYLKNNYFSTVYAVKVKYDDSSSSTVKILMKECVIDNKYRINHDFCLDSIIDIDESRQYFSKDTNEVNYNYWLINRIIENPDTIRLIHIIKKHPDSEYRKKLNNYLVKLIKANYQDMKFNFIKSNISIIKSYNVEGNNTEKSYSVTLIHDVVIEDKVLHKRITFIFRKIDNNDWYLYRILKGDINLFELYPKIRTIS